MPIVYGSQDFIVRGTHWGLTKTIVATLTIASKSGIIKIDMNIVNIYQTQATVNVKDWRTGAHGWIETSKSQECQLVEDMNGRSVHCSQNLCELQLLFWQHFLACFTAHFIAEGYCGLYKAICSVLKVFLLTLMLNNTLFIKRKSCDLKLADSILFLKLWSVYPVPRIMPIQKDFAGWQ